MSYTWIDDRSPRPRILVGGRERRLVAHPLVDHPQAVAVVLEEWLVGTALRLLLAHRARRTA